MGEEELPEGRGGVCEDAIGTKMARGGKILGEGARAVGWVLRWAERVEGRGEVAGQREKRSGGDGCEAHSAESLLQLLPVLV